MNSVNKVMLIGNLTRDPEVRQTAKGASVAEIGLAVNRHYTTESGEKREEATFIDVVLWDRQAEVAGKFLRKGRAVYVEGRLQLDTWKDRETGDTRQKLKVVGERVQFLDSASKPDGSPDNHRSREEDGGNGGNGRSQGRGRREAAVA